MSDQPLELPASKPPVAVERQANVAAQSRVFPSNSARLKATLQQALDLARELKPAQDSNPLTDRLMQLLTIAEVSAESPELTSGVPAALTDLQQQVAQLLNEQDALRQRLAAQQRLGRTDAADRVRQGAPTPSSRVSGRRAPCSGP